MHANGLTRSSGAAHDNATGAQGVQRWAARLLAVVLPLFALSLGGALLTRPPTPGDPGPRVAAHAAIMESEPRVVLLGNSLVGFGIDEVQLARELGVDEVGKLWEPTTQLGNWYLFAKNMIYGSGHHPELIVIGGRPAHWLDARLSGDRQVRSMIEYGGEDDPIIARKVLRRSGGPVAAIRLQQRRRELREALSSGIRELSVGLALARGPAALRERGRAVAEPALEAVFGGEDGLDLGLRERVLPVAELVVEVEHPEEMPPIEESLLPDMIQMAKEKGTRVVFVWMPVTDAGAERGGVTPQRISEMLKMFNENGVALVDLSELDLSETLFRDRVHLNPEGRRKVTSIIGDRLRDLDALGDSPLPPAPLPLVLTPRVRREGSNPAPVTLEATALADVPCGWEAPFAAGSALSPSRLQSLRVAAPSPWVVLAEGQPLPQVRSLSNASEPCAGRFYQSDGTVTIITDERGPFWAKTPRLTAEVVEDQVGSDGFDEDGLWIFPGTAVVFEVDGSEAGARVLRFDLWLEPFPQAGAGGDTVAGGASAEVTVGGSAMRLSERRGWQWGHRRAKMADGPVEVRVRVPEGGALMYLRALRASDGDRSAWLAGTELAVAPAVVRVLTPDSPQPSVSEPNWVFPLEAGEPLGQGPTWTVAVPELASLGDDVIGERHCPRCTPLRVVEDGVELVGRHLECDRLPFRVPGAWCFAGGRVHFVPSDASRPDETDRRYSLVLSSDRHTRAGWWLYPGDTMRISVSRSDIRTLQRGGATLELSGAYVVGDPDSAIHVEVIADKQPLLRATLTARQLEESPLTFALDEPMSPDARSVEISVTVDEVGVYAILGSIALREADDDVEL